MTPPATDRRWFGPTVVLGVLGTGIAAFAGGKPWAAPDGGAGSTLVDKSGGHVPLAAALGLVGLAVVGRARALASARTRPSISGAPRPGRTRPPGGTSPRSPPWSRCSQ